MTIENQLDHVEDGILSKVTLLADKLGNELVLPRICSRQTHGAKTTSLHFGIITEHGFTFRLLI
ncbi:cytochrome b5 reductase 4-like X4, partial [Biomphalaria glabrata]